MALLGIHELIHGNGVIVGHDLPIVGIAVDARLQVRGELKDFESDVLPFQSHTRGGYDENGNESHKNEAQNPLGGHLFSSRDHTL